MEQRIATLFASVGNALDSSTYTYADSDYLVRKALVKFLDGENALVASARKIQDSTEVVDSVLNYIVSTDFSVEDPAEWYRKAMRIVVEFSDFAFRNEMSADSARYAALLPEGHPRALNTLSLTASAQRNALAAWMAADPRLDEESSAQIEKLYSMHESSSELDVEFEYLKAEAMVASGRMPEELLPMTAAFNLTRAQRSAISSFVAKFRRRDRKGQFADEFGRLGLIFGTKDGGFFSQAPKVVGPGRTPENVIVEFDGSDSRIPNGLYEVKASLGENIQAYLPKSAVKDLPAGREVVAEGDKQFAINLDDMLATKLDAPLNWEKSGKGFKSKDGKFVAEPVSIADAQKAIDRAGERGDDLIISGVGSGDAFDPEASEAFLIADAKGKSLGVAQGWAGIQEIAVANGAGFGQGAFPTRGPAIPGIAPGGSKDPSNRLVGLPETRMATPEELAEIRKKPLESLTDQELSDLLLDSSSKRLRGDREGIEYSKVMSEVARRNKLANKANRPKGVSENAKFMPGRRTYGGGWDNNDYWQEPDGSLVVVDQQGNVLEKRPPLYTPSQRELDARKKIQDELDGKTSFPDLDQDVPGGIDKSKLSPSMLGEGYNFSKEGENSWVQEGVGSNGESYSVSKAPNGKWVVSERSGSEGDNAKERDLQSFDNALEAFEYANDQGATPSEFDEEWVNELQKDQSGPDLDQNVKSVVDSVDRSKLSPGTAKKFAKELDEMDSAIAGNNPNQINNLLEKAAVNSNIPDDVYGALASAKDARYTRGQIVENAIAGGSKEDLEALAADPKFAGWSDRIQDALAQDVDLDQDAPTLSEKQSEPATGKQYAFLQEFLEEKDLDPVTEQALKDALENKNLNKTQASSLIALGRTAGFKPGVDPSKPSDRMLNSLQGYLATKDLAPSEIKDALDSLQKDGSRDNVDALLNKLRRKKDKPVELNQGISSLTKYSEGSYEWEDSYNNVGVNKTKNGWEVEYTNPDLNERGGQTWHNQIFNSEAEALAFAEELVKQNQGDAGYDRAASDFAGMGDFFRGVDLDQDVKGTTADKATDKQWNFLQSLLDGKKIDDPNLESAVRSALEDKKLTKGEVGAFIGALRSLEDKPNARREPSAKQIASIKRALLERDLTPEERKSMQDKLAAGLSFDEASEMLNDLKKRDITPMGMINLLDALKSDQDIDSLRYLLEKPEYSEYRTDIKDTLRQLALDTEDPNLQEFIDAREEPDLDQDVPAGKAPTNTTVEDPAEQAKLDMDYILGELSEELAQEIMDRNFEGRATADFFEGKGKAEESYGDEAKSDWGAAYDKAWSELADNIYTDVERFYRDAPEAVNLMFDKTQEYVEAEFLSDIEEALAKSFKRWTAPQPDLDQGANDINGRYKAKFAGSPRKAALEDLRVGLDGDASDIANDLVRGRNNAWLDSKNPVMDTYGDMGQSPNWNSGYNEAYTEVINKIINDPRVVKALDNPPLERDSDGEISTNFDEWADEVADAILFAASDYTVDDAGPDLDQDVSSSVSRNDIAEKLAEDIDAIESLAINGKELKNYLEEFDRTRYASTAAEMAAEVDNMSNYVDDPELKQRLRDLSARLNDEIVDRFGIADAARADGDEILDLDDIERAVQDDIEMFFETDVEKIERELNKNDSYGDSKSGGAEVFVSQEEDGTWTASVQYDRSDDQFNGEDRSEVIAQAAVAAADYNSDVMPTAYSEVDDLAGQAAQAQTPDAASELADRMDALAEAMDSSRGDRGLASNLRQYGLRIRDMIAARDARNQSEAESQPLNSETLDEMSVDPDLNPEGYADYVGGEIFALVEGKGDKDLVNNFISADRRVELVVEDDAYTVIVDGEEIFSGEPPSDNWDFVAEIEKAVKDHFSKKD